MRVLVCGGRNFRGAKQVWGELDALWRAGPHDAMMVIQGGATGADQLARWWCVQRRVPYENYPPDWMKFGRAAGPIRNRRMIEKGQPDIVVAFPGGSGTADLVAKARAAGVKVLEIGEQLPT